MSYRISFDYMIDTIKSNASSNNVLSSKCKTYGLCVGMNMFLGEHIILIIGTDVSRHTRDNKRTMYDLEGIFEQIENES